MNYNQLSLKSSINCFIDNLIKYRTVYRYRGILISLYSTSLFHAAANNLRYGQTETDIISFGESGLFPINYYSSEF